MKKGHKEADHKAKKYRDGLFINHFLTSDRCAKVCDIFKGLNSRIIKENDRFNTILFAVRRMTNPEY